MRISDKNTKIILSLIIALSLAISVFFMAEKQGFHEDELLTYNLANSSKQLSVDGGWNTPEDFNEYLTVSPENRFNYKQVVRNQITDASHPPLYYALVHTVCSFFPGQFSKWLAYPINITAMLGALIFLFKIAKKVTDNNFYALMGTAVYALSLACVTMTIYLRMYAMLTFFVLAFMYLTLKFYERKNTARLSDCLALGAVVLCGTLTQYYFILFECLTGLFFLVFKICEKYYRDLIKYVITVLMASAAALCIYPFIIENVLGGNRGFSSLKFSVDGMTVVSYIIYKLGTYGRILAKELFINQLWLLALCVLSAVGFGFYFRFFRKQRLSRRAVLAFAPAVMYFVLISLVSPFNSDRYVAASLPLIAMLFAFVFIKIFSLIKNEKIRLALPVSMLLAFVVAFLSVEPYYIYGKTSLNKPVTDNCVFVGTAMLEWNKCIDKLKNYDSVMIAQTADFDPTLGSQLEDFAKKRGIITNGEISSIADAYMNNGGEKEKTDSLSALKNDEKLNSLDSVTVYISRLSDTESVIRYISENTKFKNYELIQSDLKFEDFYNWYDYFVTTESYCNVYRFY